MFDETDFGVLGFDELLMVVRAFPAADVGREGVLSERLSASAVMLDWDGFVLPGRGLVVVLEEAVVR